MVAQTGEKIRLGDVLLEQGVVSREQLDEALVQQKQSGGKKLLGEVLVSMGFCSEDDIIRALAGNYGVPYAKINPRLVDASVIDTLPREFLDRHRVLPLFKVRNVLTVAMAEPSNMFLADEMSQISGLEIQVVAASAQDIVNTLQSYVSSANVFVIDEIIEDINAKDFELIESQVEDIANVEDAGEHSPVVKLVNYLVFDAVRQNASDIHIEPDDNMTRVRYRVDGTLYEAFRPPHRMHASLVSRIKIMSQLDISERRLPQDGGIHVMMQGRPIDLRISTLPGPNGEKVVIRIFDNRNMMVNLEKLGFEFDMLEEFKKLIASPNGILLVTGPTGSGKSTTLYSVLNELNSPDVNISTVEDPIEFNLRGINQFQTNERIGFTFSAALRSLLRQDPDIIMVGEVRDEETAKIAVQAALTGHLVISTLHTNDAAAAITRLQNIGVEPYLVSASVVGILAQRLVRKICTHCKETYSPPLHLRRLAGSKIEGIDTFYRGKGCPKCRNTGFQGRIGVYELMAMSDEIRDLVVHGAPLDEIRKAAMAGNMVTLRADGMKKVRAGITTLEEVIRISDGR
ncbi:MAG: Flp pilus assembly complex ATPase component TadA [Phycisphaerae bacterium]|nr:Flp pilus assembly complex ATPase component TadA [Phycisphaerae bacterium]